ncbi:MAG: hypothetical protein IJN18_04255 [Clostridia bacterium]|nr:hypothetical protein [Clostridia bacterium]
MKHPNKPSAQPTVWDSQWQKRRFVWTKSHTRFAIFAVVGVLCVAFLWWRVYNLGPESPQDLRNDFYTYVFERMEEYKPRYALYDQLGDPAALMQGEHWETTAAADAQSAAQALLGEGYTLQDWEELKQAEAGRLWQAWYSAEKASRMDVFIITELSLHIDHQTLPALQENSWLARNVQGDQYLLVYADGIWGVKRMAWFR